MATAIEIRGLKTAFGKNVIHENLNLTVEEGAVVSIIGGSGTGKTTLLRQILGLEKPAAGEITVLGVDRNTATPDELHALNSRWGVLFQRGALFSALTVFDNIALPLRELRGLPETLNHFLFGFLGFIFLICIRIANPKSLAGFSIVKCGGKLTVIHLLLMV